MSYSVSDIQAILGDMPGVEAPTRGTEGPSATTRFGDWFAHELGEVNGQLVQAEQGLQRLAAGDATNLHDTMMRLEEARLSFQLASQFRARVLEAYQEIMRMQV